MTDTEMRLEAGSVVALRFYDLGRTVDVDALASRASGEVERPRFPSDAGLRYGSPVLELALDDAEIPLEDGRVFADASLRVFDFGIAVVALRVLVGGLDWDRFTERMEEIAGAVAGRAAAWDQVEQRARTALQRGNVSLHGGAVAQHVFVIARRFANAVPLDRLVEGDHAASIVSRDWLPLTSIARNDLVRGARVVGRDLLVAGDERTFIVESKPGSGVPDAVEAALAQRACYDRVGGIGAHGKSAAERARRAASLVGSERGLRLATVYATARDRFGLADAEAAALRQGARASTPWLPIVIVAAITALLTTFVVLALS